VRSLCDGTEAAGCVGPAPAVGAAGEEGLTALVAREPVRVGRRWAARFACGRVRGKVGPGGWGAVPR
jgi:hypothetical protein